MSSRRCPMCLSEWPAGSIKHGSKVYEFKTCPDCGEVTWSSATGQAMSPAEAVTRCLRAEFNRYYEKWDKARKGPSPDEVGVAEAREILTLESWLHSQEEPC